MTKPTFGWRPSTTDMRQRLACAMTAQKFFTRITGEGLSATVTRTKYQAEIEAMKASMTEMGILVEQPEWFRAVFH